MDIKITSRHFNGSRELQENINKSFERLVKFNSTLRDVHVILDAEKKNVRSVEAIFNILEKTLVVSSSAKNMHKALEAVLLKSERMLKKENQKLKMHRSETLSALVSD